MIDLSGSIGQEEYDEAWEEDNNTESDWYKGWMSDEP